MINFGVFLLFLIGLAATDLNNPPVYAKPGETIHLPCSYQSQIAMHFSWYKHEPGQSPRLISTIYKYDHNAQFYHNFKNNSRFSVLNEKGVHHLVIRNIQISDSATYYCGSAFSNVMEFIEGTELIVEGFKSYAVVKLHAFIESGDSVTLMCTVLKQNCVGNHSVYWLIHEPRESHPRIIRADGTSIDQCDWISGAGFSARRCVYSFSKKDLNLSVAGTYYCAVAACGEMPFGNGTKLHIIGTDSKEQMMTFVLLSIVRTVLLLITIAIITVWYCMNSKRMSKESCSPSAMAFRDRRSRPEGRPGPSCSQVI